jgi:hypothetical protein
MRDFFRLVGRFVAGNWRGFFALLPLPLLGLAASYGVYRFALVFVPGWVAIVTASSFEFVYIGLAVYNKFGEKERRSALYVSLGAVVTSILYNVLDGFFHRRPELLTNMPWWGDLLLSVVHGAPLAILAFLVSRLVMHPPTATNNRSESLKSLVGGRPAAYSLDQLKTVLDGREIVKRGDVMTELGCSATTATELLGQGVDAGLLRKNGVGYYVEN